MFSFLEIIFLVIQFFKKILGKFFVVHMASLHVKINVQIII